MSTTVMGGSFAILSPKVKRFNTSLGGRMSINFTRRRPNLDGGRVSNKVPARFMGDDRSFTPPLRTPPKRLYYLSTMPLSVSPMIPFGISNLTYYCWKGQVY